MRAKSILALFLILAMLFTMTACQTQPSSSSDVSGSSDVSDSGSESDESGSTGKLPKEEWKGLKFRTIMAVTEENKDAVWNNTDIWNALQDWMAETGVELELGEAGQDGAIAAQAAGKGYDLMRISAFPSMPAAGICQPVEDYIEGYDVFDQIEVDSWKGHVWGLSYSKCNYIIGMQYNDSLFKRMGLKSPKEYYLEDNWTWETFLECARATTQDTDGDGVTDRWGCSYVDLAKYFDYAIIEFEEDGHVKSVMDNDLTRDVVQFVYDLCSVEQVVPPASVDKSTLEFENDAIAMRVWPSLYGKVLDNGDLISCVPIPKQHQEDEWHSHGINDYRYYVGISCEHPEVMVDLAAHMQATAHKSYRDKRLEMKNQGEDLDYILELEEVLQKTNKCQYFDLKGVTTFLASDHSGDWGSIYTTPPATSLASLIEVHKAQIDTYNKNYVDFE